MQGRKQKMNASEKIKYVPTEEELNHMRFLRSELAWADKQMQKARQAVAEYEIQIRSKRS
jgi:hypothetical protein